MSVVIKLCAAVVRQQVGRDDAEAEGWRLLALAAREEIDELRADRDVAQAATVNAALIHADLVRERDEARSEVERMRRLLDHATQANPGTSTLVMLMNEANRLQASLASVTKARLAHAEADAEQAIHNEAFAERQRVISYIRARLAHATMDDRVSMRERGVMIDLGNAIERGEHDQ